MSFNGSTQQPSASAQPVKLFIGRFPRTLKEDDMRPWFTPHGTVEEIKIIKDSYSGASKGDSGSSYVVELLCSVQ